jgi:hypothetical protein
LVSPSRSTRARALGDRRRRDVDRSDLRARALAGKRHRLAPTPHPTSSTAFAGGEAGVAVQQLDERQRLVVKPDASCGS